jgi:ribosome assembly protein 3
MMWAQWAAQIEVYAPASRRRPRPRTGGAIATFARTQQHHQMPTAKPTAPRKRNRKRKRRQASSSSSSDSLDSSSDEAEVSKNTPANKATLIKPQAKASSAEASSPSLSSSSPSSSDSEEGDDDDDGGDAPHVVGAPVTHPASTSAIPQRSDSEPAKTRERLRSPSPSPPPPDAPPFLPPEGSSSRAQDEQALRDRFRQFWMASVADAFADDLEQIRQVRPHNIRVLSQPSLTPGVKGAEYD